MNNQDQHSDNSTSAQGLGFLDIAIVLAKHKRLVVGLPLLAILISIIVSFVIPKSYVATARIIPPQQPQSVSASILAQLGGLAGVAGSSVGIRNPADLYVGMLKSRTVSDALIKRFDLLKLYDETTLHDARKKLEERSIIVVGKDGIISINVEDADPLRAASLANGYVDALNQLTQTVAISEASQRRAFFERQLVASKNQLADAEIALRRTQEATGLIKLDDQARAIIENIARLRGQLAAKEVQLRAMRSFATDQNPELIRLQQELSGLRSQLSSTEKQRELEGGDIFVPTGKVPEAGLEYLRKLREVKYHETLFELLAKQFELAKIDEAKEGSVVQVVDNAVPPDKKYRPRRSLIVFLSFIGALVLAVILAFVRERVEGMKNDEREISRLRALRDLLHRR